MPINNSLSQYRSILALWILACAALWPSNAYAAELGQSGTFEKQSIEIPGATRNYRLFVPENYDPQRPIGIVFGFQSYGSPDLNLLPTFEQHAGDAYWICLSVPQRGPADGGYEHQLDTATNQDLITCQALLDLMKQHYKIDADRVFAHGISSGALFTLTLANAWPGVMAAINPVAAPDWDINAKLTNADYAIIASGGTEDSYRAVNMLLHSSQYFKQHGSDGEFHVYAIGHQMPPANQNVNPAQSFETQVCEYFLNHPRNLRSKTYAPARLAAAFRDEFEGSGAVPSAERWRVETFAADTGGVSGAIGGVNGYRFRTKNNWMISEGFGAGLRGGVCFSGFVEPQATTWSVGFVNDTRCTDTCVWPLVMRDMRGRVVAFGLTSGKWGWGRWNTGLEFRSASLDDAKVRAMDDNAVPTQGIMVLEYDRTAGTWKLSDAQGKQLAAGTDGFKDELDGAVQFGFGVRGNYCEARFDWVEIKTAK